MKLVKLFKLGNGLTLSLLMGLAITLLATGLIMVNQPPQVAQAQFSDLMAAQSQYSNIAGTDLGACALCHTATFGFNSYGEAYKSSDKDFVGIENQDSDGDGFTNLEEIMALTFPGDPASMPAVPTPTPPPADTPTPPPPVDTPTPPPVDTPTPPPADTPTPPPPVDTPTPPPSTPAPQPGNVVVSISANGSSSVTVGDEFEVKIMAQGADAASAIYGAQFKLNFPPDHLNVVAGTLQPSAAMSPRVIAVSEIDNDEGMVQLAYSRQGDVEGLTGDVILATVRFRAVSATDEAELSLSEDALILGTKAADSIPVSINDLEVSIVDPGSSTATVSGNIALEGKTDHSGATVLLQGTSFLAITDSSGNYSLSNVAEGTYATIEADAPGRLRAICTDKAVSAPITELNAVTLLSGDLNGDDLIDISDATTVGVDFGTSNNRSDLNGDGTVNVLDLILVAKNYGTNGPSDWTC